jgi:nitric oxide reductase NorE protein
MTLTRQSRSSATTTIRRDPPAEPWLWYFLLADMTVFAGFFGYYLWALGNDRAAFAADAAHLIVPLGLANTIVLLSSSYTVVRAVRAHTNGSYASARGWLRLTLAGAAVFIVIKLSEYGIEISAGHTLRSSHFFMYYFVLTGLHLMHVTIGVILAGTWLRSLRPGGQPASLRWAESSAGYWHMVDLLWMIIFSFLYIGSHA